MKNKSEKPQTTATDTKNAVFERIAAEGITPKSRLAFIWTAWFARLVLVVVVVVGAIATATIVFTELSAGWEFYDATHDNALTFFVASAPLAWIVVFVGVIFLAHYQWRRCPQGYRWPCSHVIGAILGGSVLLGVVLHVLGAGHVVDGVMGKHMPGYRPAAEMRAHLWQRPETGRLSGYVRVFATSTVLTDVENREWQLRSDDAALAQIKAASGTRVRIIGRASTTSSVFHVCKVLSERNDIHDFKAMRQRRVIHQDALDAAKRPAPPHRPCGELSR